jgi:endonuclease/exonuclease/phosphatase family metal-dependent hydrolase
VAAARLRVVSWNIRAAIGPGPFPDRWWRRVDADRLRAIGSFVASLEADLVALQEVAVLSRDGDLVDNAGDLGRQLGMEVAYGAVRSFEVREADALRGIGTFGNAILSRHPLSSVRCVALPAAPSEELVEAQDSDHPAAGVRWADAPSHLREPRCLLLGELPGLRVGTAHFSHIGSGERLLQAEAAAAAFGNGPALLLGDLNAAIEAPELAPLSAWADAFVEPPGDQARVTTDDGYRIDQVLVRGASASPARVLRESGDLSDHYPVMAEVAVAETPSSARDDQPASQSADVSDGLPSVGFDS